MRLNAPFVPHADTVAVTVYGFSLSMLHTHRLAQSKGLCAILSADMIDAKGQHTVTIVVPPKFDQEGHPVYECPPVADPWRTKPPNWEYMWKLTFPLYGVQVCVRCSENVTVWPTMAVPIERKLCIELRLAIATRLT